MSPTCITNYKFQMHILISASHLTCNIWYQTCYCIKKWNIQVQLFVYVFIYLFTYPIWTKAICNFTHNPTCMYLLTSTCTLYMTHITHFYHLFLYCWNKWIHSEWLHKKLLHKRLSRHGNENLKRQNLKFLPHYDLNSLASYRLYWLILGWLQWKK